MARQKELESPTFRLGVQKIYYTNDYLYGL